MKLSAIVTLKKDVLDPQGKAIQKTLETMGFEGIKNLRQGKFFEIEIDDSDQIKAKKKFKIICEKLLTNSVIEDYKILS